MKSGSTPVDRLRQALSDADAVVIGAGAGLSTAAGFAYSGERFARYFSDFEKKYGFHDMYSGGFCPYDSPEARWAYWSRYIWINRYQNALKPVYDDLRKQIQGKDYFVLTTNVDHCFQKAGFDKKRLFYTQGGLRPVPVQPAVLSGDLRKRKSRPADAESAGLCHRRG